MDEKSALREDIERRRSSISHTVDQLENRVRPGRVAARGKYQMTQRLSDWKDNMMGGDGQIKEKMGNMTESAGNAPQQVTSRTRGNPLAAGLIAVGAGALIGGMLPATRQERRMAREIQPDLNRAASEMGEAGRGVADEVKGQVDESMANVKESAKSAGQDLADDAKETAKSSGGSSGGDTGRR